MICLMLIAIVTFVSLQLVSFSLVVFLTLCLLLFVSLLGVNRLMLLVVGTIVCFLFVFVFVL